MPKRTLNEIRAAAQAGTPHAKRPAKDPADAARSGISRRQTARPEATQWREELQAGLLERQAAEQGFERVAGVDEAGRGPLAGPLVAAAVVLGHPLPELNDSKQLTPATRARLFAMLQNGPHAIGIAIIPPEEIDRLGIQPANYAAMRRAVNQITPPPDYLLVDGFDVPGCPLPQCRVIKGDCRSQSIAAASILAKVTRDRIMEELDGLYPQYGFARHKGYGTREHLEAIARFGPCPHHRRSFAPLARSLETEPLFSKLDKDASSCAT
ncbi:MAG TPA: ribonuclease HII [Candidatus Hydrogenedentes bacterium]|nr:ribonuclease HII [Candidatus Hydrogenedentota bacterium]